MRLFSGIVRGQRHASSSVSSAEHSQDFGAYMARFSNMQMLRAIRPIGTLCRLFGVFPFTFEVIGDTLYLKYSSGGWLLYSFLIFLITTCYVIFQATSLFLGIKDREITMLAAQLLWLISAIPGYAVQIFMFFQGKVLIRLFEEWCSIEKILERLFCPVMTRKHIRRFEVFYATIAVLSISLCAYHAVDRYDTPVYPFFYLPKDSYNETHRWLYAAFQTAIIGWVWAGLLVLEGVCCFFATVIRQCMNTFISGMDYTFTSNKGRADEFLDDVLGKTNKIGALTHDDFMRVAVHSVLMEGAKTKGVHPNPNNETKEKAKGDEVCTNGTTPFRDTRDAELAQYHKEDYLLFVIKKIQTVSLLQTQVNRTMGPLILLDVGQLVFMACILIFLPVKFAHQLDRFDVVLIFAGNGVAVLVRLVLIVVCLGNVYSNGQDVNVSLAKAMTSCSLSSGTQNPVLAHLSVFSSNPICFTAWDFFAITKGTLLAAFSLISTYAIVFFQTSLN